VRAGCIELGIFKGTVLKKTRATGTGKTTQHLFKIGRIYWPCTS
jgi:hypothetical protein